MKRFPLYLLFTALVAVFHSCNPIPVEDTPDFYLVNIEGAFDDFSTMIYKDEANVVFVSEYESGIIKELYLVSEQDTLAMAFSENGFPEYLKVNDNHAVFGSFSERSVHALLIDKEGNYTVADLETDINWREYGETLGEISTKGRFGKTLKKEWWNLASSAMVELTSRTGTLLTGVAGMPTPVSIGTFAFSSIGYAVSDNPTWWDTVDFVSNGTNVSYLTIQAVRVAELIGGAVPMTFVITGNLIAWGIVFWEIYDGIKKGKFGSPFKGDFKMISREIQDGVWLGYTDAICPWTGDTGTVPLKMGYANFDISTLEWGVKSCPDWVDVDVVRAGYNSCFHYTVQRNDNRTAPGYGDRDGVVRIYVTGVANVDYDLEFKITEHSMVYASPSSVSFEDGAPKTISVYSTSEDDWEINSCPPWLTASKEGILTQRVRGLTLTPTSLTDASPGEVILKAAAFYTGELYDVRIKVSPSKESESGIYAVDLGLSVKWASCNVGATEPWDYGDYFAWGETEPKENYNWSTYKWCNGDLTKLTKYCTNSRYWDSSSSMDNKIILDSGDDAASANWGGNWRMPKDSDWSELLTYCSWTWTDDYKGTGIAGQVATSNKAGFTDKSIFLPAAGRREGTGLYEVGSNGYYWSSSLYTDYSYIVRYFGFFSCCVERSDFTRYHGLSVRPVCP